MLKVYTWCDEKLVKSPTYFLNVVTLPTGLTGPDQDTAKRRNVTKLLIHGTRSKQRSDFILRLLYAIGNLEIAYLKKGL